MMYRQITFAERYTLGVLRRGGLSPAAIARTLGRHRSTILREVRRNSADSDGLRHPTRLQSDRCEAEPPAAKATRLSNPGGMLWAMTISVALQS